jgi:DNA-binding protein H-NS
LFRDTFWHIFFKAWHSATIIKTKGEATMATLESIQTRIAQLQAQAEDLMRKQSSVVLEKIHALMDKHDITTSDIAAHLGGKHGRRLRATSSPKSPASTVKYRDPKTGATWTGHGRAPGWIANVKNRGKFLIDGASQVSGLLAKASSTAVHRVRGPQPPMYRDPKTGATWTGRGRAPAWIAGAKDRARFLIAAQKSTEAAAPKAAKKALPVKKAAARKSTIKSVTTNGRVSSSRNSTSKTVGAKKAAARKTVARNAASRAASSSEQPQAAESASTPAIA